MSASKTIFGVIIGFIVVFILILILMKSVLGFECDYEPFPVLEDKITWICWDESETNDYSCVSYVDVNDSVIQTNPQIDYSLLEKVIKEYEFEETFESLNGVVNIYFTDYHLIPDTNFDFNVICVADDGSQMNYSAIITPKYKDLREIVEREQYVKENAGIIVVFISALLILITIAVVLFKDRLKEVFR